MLSLQRDARKTLGFQNNALDNNEIVEIIACIRKDSESIVQVLQTSWVNVWKYAYLYPQPTTLESSRKHKTRIPLLARAMSLYTTCPLENSTIYSWEKEQKANNVLILLWNSLDPTDPLKRSSSPQELPHYTLGSQLFWMSLNYLKYDKWGRGVGSMLLFPCLMHL